MKIRPHFETYDGQVHTDYADALRHLNARHAQQLAQIAERIAALDRRPIAIGHWVDKHLNLFQELIQIRQDWQIRSGDVER